jgi:hypothetical protein
LEVSVGLLSRQQLLFRCGNPGFILLGIAQAGEGISSLHVLAFLHQDFCREAIHRER